MILASLVFAKCCEDPLMFHGEKGNAVTVNGGSIPLTDDAATNQEDSRKQTQVDKYSQRVAMAQHYGAIFVCLTILERWLELAIRPNRKVSNDISTIFCMSQSWIRTENNNEGHASMGSSLNEKLRNLLENTLDDLAGIKNLVDGTRRFLWTAALKPSIDDHLTVASSKITIAEQGLFAACHLPADTICCYYSGNIHSARSVQSSSLLPDASYLLRIGTMSKQPWWHETLRFGVHQVYNENQAGVEKRSNLLASAYLSLQEQWDHIMVNSSATAEFYVDHSTNVSSKARFINDCLQEGLYNVKFVRDERTERAAVVTLREIEVGEELYVSYGQAYWDSLEANTGIVPQRLRGPSRVDGTIQGDELESRWD
jgi:hypothetical protein